MWAFRQFPDKIEYTPNGEERPTYQVEVLGYLKSQGNIAIDNVILIVFRENTSWVKECCEIRENGCEDINTVQLLPINEFEERFRHYRLINQ